MSTLLPAAHYYIPTILPFPIWTKVQLNDERTEWEWCVSTFGKREISKAEAEAIAAAASRSTTTPTGPTGALRSTSEEHG